MMHVVITYGAQTRPMLEAGIEARLRILDAFDGPAALLELEPDNDSEPDCDAEPNDDAELDPADF